MSWKRMDIPIEGVSACPRGTATPCACNGTGRLPAPPSSNEIVQGTYGVLEPIPDGDPRMLYESYIEGQS
jgi:hypothetical protein